MTTSDTILRKIRVTTTTDNHEATPEKVREAREAAVNNAKSADINLAKIQEAFNSAGQEMRVNQMSKDEFKEKDRSFKAQPFNKQAPLPEIKTTVQEAVETAKSFQPRITTPVDRALGEHAQRLTLLSNGIFYSFPDLFAKPFELPQFIKLSEANRKDSESMVLDTVSEVISQDARDLTEKDFRFLMYHLRINSFVRNPYRLTWTSFYGNQNTITINKSTLNVVELDASREEYLEWVERGFCMPTMRDLEEFDNIKEKLSAEDKFIWARAKYLQGGNYKEKMEHARKLTPDEFFVDTKQFIEKFENYGVTEFTEAQDQFFNKDEAINTLQNYVKNANAMLTISKSEEDQLDWSQKLLGFQAEIVRLSNMDEAAPKRETIEFSIKIADFFSVV